MPNTAENVISYIGLARKDAQVDPSVAEQVKRQEREINVLRQSLAALEQSRAQDVFETERWILIRKLEKLFQIIFLPIAAIAGVIAAAPVVFSLLFSVPDTPATQHEIVSGTAPAVQIEEPGFAVGVAEHGVPGALLDAPAQAEAPPRLSLPRAFDVPDTFQSDDLSFAVPDTSGPAVRRSLRPPVTRKDTRSALDREMVRRRSVLLACARDPNCP